MATVLVTGGAGYIGSHACKALKAAGHLPVTYDNLETGWRDAVRFGPLEEGDLSDRDRLDAVLAHWKPDVVMHFAALINVGEATREPGKYWRNNLGGTLTLLEAMVAADIRRMVFSSTCAIYGEQDGVLLTTASPQAPINAYGASKRAVENMLRDFDLAHGLRSVSFRYFNVAGADPEGEIGEFHDPETHLIPITLLAALGRRPGLVVNGTDYPTPDGTCVRDFVHVCDLVDAHVLGIGWLMQGGGTTAFNLGSGRGFSVREVIATAERVTGRPIPVSEGPRREGDASFLVSGGVRARELLGWAPKRSDLATMIEDAWRWHRRNGYSG